MLRLSGVLIVMEVVALVVGYTYFGWPALLVGVPTLVGTGLVLLVVHLSERPGRRLRDNRAECWDEDAKLPGGLMSGFFEVS